MTDQNQNMQIKVFIEIPEGVSSNTSATKKRACSWLTVSSHAWRFFQLRLCP